MEKTSKQAAEEYADNYCRTRDELFWMRKSDFLAGAKFKESQLIPLIEEMRAGLKYYSESSAFSESSYISISSNFKSGNHATRVLASIEQKLKEIMGRSTEERGYAP